VTRDSPVRLGIAGAGTMGSGIAALALRSGVATVLYDIAQAPLERGLERIARSRARAIERDDLSPEAAADWGRLLSATTALEDLRDCTVIVEAAPEDAQLKGRVLADLAKVAAEATLASNTSSIAISGLAEASGTGLRLVGLHFFNPPERMRLIELVSTGQASDEHVERGRHLGERLGRRVITVRDTPGFLVNRCARPYYLEALRIVEDGAASIAEVDRACVEQGGFPLGPFELMDLVGIDVSLAATRSMYLQADGEPRWRPTPTQRSMVAARRLGRKSGDGFYPSGASWRDQPGGDPVARRAMLERIVAQLINEAAFAIADGVAASELIDEAMMLGLNHPRGPGGWLRDLGEERVVGILDSLWDREHDPRYRVAPALRVAAKSLSESLD
jgi:3-hydroxybutyryl-CoA dehydrogenase